MQTARQDTLVIELKRPPMTTWAAMRERSDYLATALSRTQDETRELDSIDQILDGMWT